MTVEKLSAWIPVSDEMVVDYGIGTTEQQAESQNRIQARWDELERQWRALPWYVRLERTVRFRVWDLRDRAMRRIHRTLFPYCDS
jgi:hypothetical protein